MIIDIHAYWDPGRMPLSQMQQEIRKHGLGRVILSPPCTRGFEPDKSPVMYATQRILLRSDLLRPLAELTARSFYDARGNLRPFWRLFTRSGRPIHKVIQPDNTGLLKVIDSYESFYAWYWLNPSSLPNQKQILQESQHPQVVGFKLHAYWHPFTVEEARRVFTAAEKMGLPVYLILGFGWLAGSIRLLEQFPTVPVIFGYGGFPYFDRLWERIQAFRNARVDLTSFHIDQRGIVAAVRSLGPERCLYGSDCPYNFPDKEGRFDYSKTFDRIQRLHLDPREKEQILGGNTQQLLFVDKSAGIQEVLG